VTSGTDGTAVAVARRGGSRRELAAAVVAGAAGAAVALLALRQAWAHVLTAAPRPMQASVQAVTGSAIAPFAEGLAIAALATLLAVLATAGLARRLAGLLLAALGVGLAASVLTISTAAALAAASAQSGPATTPGSTAGSTTQGDGTPGLAAPGLTGFPRHATLAAAGWQALAVTGALLIILAGAVVFWRARQMATMSARYDLPGSAETAGGSAGATPLDEPGQGEPARADAATLWEALSRGDDPTVTAR
jgi:uncharacterized membrane protein (TIGR02234 family)